tara:strand:+ start:2812 stop:3234 length:423 start_codon:yes stop_codon:yes gene_type:complete
MKICGVELSGNDAVICLLYLEHQSFNLPDCRVRKLSLPKAHTRADLQQFQKAFAQLMSDYGVEKVAIKERPLKGKFAGGAVGFKLEAAIQLMADIDVLMVSPQDSKLVLSENRLPISFTDTGLKAFQETAFTVAYVAHVK